MSNSNRFDTPDGTSNEQPQTDADSPFCTPAELTEDELMQRREALMKMAALTGVAAPSILTVLQSRRVLAASGGEE